MMHYWMNRFGPWALPHLISFWLKQITPKLTRNCVNHVCVCLYLQPVTRSNCVHPVCVFISSAGYQIKLRTSCMRVYIFSRLPDQTVYILYVCLYLEPVTRSNCVHPVCVLISSAGYRIKLCTSCMCVYILSRLPDQRTLTVWTWLKTGSALCCTHLCQPSGGVLLFEDGKSK